MLMIFIGPLISQAMPMDHRMPMSMGMDMDMDMDMSMAMPGHVGMEQSADEHHPPSAEHPALWEKCGYCTLLFSCPALPQSLSFAALDGPRPAAVIVPQTRLGHARETTFPGARTRAPPVFQ